MVTTMETEMLLYILLIPKGGKNVPSVYLVWKISEIIAWPLGNIMSIFEVEVIKIQITVKLL